jgi:hypothetical protein
VIDIQAYPIVQLKTLKTIGELRTENKKLLAEEGWVEPGRL